MRVTINKSMLSHTNKVQAEEIAALSAKPKSISIVAALAHECPAPMCSGQPCKWDGKTYSAEPEGKEKGE